MARNRFGRYCRPKYILFTLRTLFFGPLIVACAISLLLAFVPQMREIYVGIFEEMDIERGIAGVIVMMLLSAAIYTWQSRLSTPRIDRIYADHGDLFFDGGLLGIRNGKAFAGAALPLAGLAAGLMLCSRSMRLNGERLNEALAQLAGQGNPIKLAYSPADFIRVSEYMFDAAVPLICVFVVFLIFLHRSRRVRRLHTGLVILAAILATVVIGGPLVLTTETVVSAARRLGPLAATGVVLIAFLAILIGLSALTRLFGWPVITTLIALAVGSTLFVALQRYYSTGEDIHTLASSPGGDAERRKKQKETFKIELTKWLDERADRRLYQSLDIDYPVFVIAAQGGGIYATSAASAYLSLLQDHCSNFSQHVFAVSAASGGAVGSSIFNDLMSREAQVRTPACKKRVDPNAPGGASLLSVRAERIVLKDHLSPWVATVLLDMVRKPAPFLSGDMHRASALELSFKRALTDLATAAPKGTCSGGQAAGTKRSLMFRDHWCPQSPAPALVLNTTWAETGYRVAFSPFPLEWAGDGTLYAFADLAGYADSPDEAAMLLTSLDNLSSMDAAMVSARFPFVVPAWQLIIPLKEKQKFANFVDGGYADNSGATTALEIYQAIDRLDKEDPALRLDPRLIILTDAVEGFSLHAAPDGVGSFDDTVSPFTTLLNVRSLLARRAVTQAVREAAGSREAGDAPGAGSKVYVVKLEQKTFPLPLGWKISRASNEIVKFMMGQPHPCLPEPAGNRASFERRDAETLEQGRLRRLVGTVASNSCAMHHVLTLLDPPRHGVTSGAPR